MRSAPAFFALPMELEDVPVELDSEQKIAVFELRYMAQMGESLKAYGGVCRLMLLAEHVDQGAERV